MFLCVYQWIFIMRDGLGCDWSKHDIIWAAGEHIPVDSLLGEEDAVGQDGSTWLLRGPPTEAHEAAGHEDRGHITRSGGEDAWARGHWWGRRGVSQRGSAGQLGGWGRGRGLCDRGGWGKREGGAGECEGGGKGNTTEREERERWNEKIRKENTQTEDIRKKRKESDKEDHSIRDQAAVKHRASTHTQMSSRDDSERLVRSQTDHNSIIQHTHEFCHLESRFISVWSRESQCVCVCVCVLIMISQFWWDSLNVTRHIHTQTHTHTLSPGNYC